VQILPLELLSPGETARIHEINGSPDVVHRLHEMGLNQGTCVEMIRPGRPCIIAVDNHRFSFRGEEAAVVLVETVTESQTV
jgi:Fe2+ transport system protein FeoA